MKITDGTAVNVVTVVGAVNATKAVYIEDGDELGAYYVGKTGNNVANTFTYTADNAIAEAQLDSVKSYYVGNKSTNAASSKYDTLKVSIAVTAKNEENFAAALAGDTASALAAIDLADSADSADYITYKVGQGYDEIKGLGIDDVIKLNGLSNTEIASLKTAVATGNEETINTAVTAVLNGKIKLTGKLMAAISPTIPRPMKLNW